MEGLLQQFFSSDFMPHGHCYWWLPGILWTNVISDLLIALAYFSIPIILLLLIRERKDIKFRGLFVLFAAFILLCGITHLFAIYTIWHGAYGLHGVLKAFTAVVSVFTALALIINRKALLAIPTTSALEQALVQAESANIAKRDFLACMSHEIRTPINGVMGMLQLALREERHPDQLKKLQSAQSSARGLLSLINDIIDFSKIEAGKLDVEQVPFDPHRLLREVLRSFAYRRSSSEVDLLLDSSALPEAELIGDPARLRQILNNLIDNALKFTPRGHVLVQVTLQPSTQDTSAAQLHCTISDTGIGIPADRIGELFQPFTQVDASTTRNYGGTGLGLAISRNLARAMGGDIEIAHSSPAGSQFQVRVEVGIAGDLPVTEPREERVLVLDDNPLSRDILKRQLQRVGYQAETCSDLPQLLQAGARDDLPVAAVLVDRNTLAQVGSDRLRQQLLTSDTKTPPVWLLDYDRGPAPPEAPLPGQRGTLSKPLCVQELRAALAGEPDTTCAGNSEQEKGGLQRYPIAVLAAEDNPVNQAVLEGLLGDMVTRFDLAANGREALQMLAGAPPTSPYQLVLMDCQMPVMDGYEATRRIRQGEAGSHHKDVFVAAVTAHAMTGDRDQCLQAGMNDYLAKPIDMEQLRTLVERVSRRS